MEETIKALDTHCMHRVSILGGKREATNTGCRGRFVMGQLGRPQETQCGKWKVISWYWIGTLSVKVPCSPK